MALFGSSASNLIGLDIGSSTIKVVSLQSVRGGYQLESAGVEPLPGGSVVDGAIAKREAVADAINHVFHSRKIKGDSIASSVSGPAVIVKRISLPARSAAEVGESIHWEAEQYIPFDIAEVYLDYHLLGPSEDGSETNVILVAAKRETIDNQSDVVAMAGKEPAIMDLDSFALHNIYEVNYKPRPDSVVALLNIGASIMNVNIATGNEFIFTRDIGMGGNYYTEYIQRDLGVSYEEAEKYKKGLAPEELKGTVSTVLQSVSEILALEVQKTFDYFRTASEFEELETIYICVGASRPAGLRDYLQETFQVPVEMLNPFQKIKADGRALPAGNDGCDFAVAAGLALRYQGDKPTGPAKKGSSFGFLTGNLPDILKKLTKR